MPSMATNVTKQAAASEESQRSSETTAQIATTEQIAKLAYTLWQQRGSPEGSPEEDWFRAEEKLRTHSEA